MIKTLFYECILANLICSFSRWLKNKGYDGEAELIDFAMLSWTKKEMSKLQAMSRK